MSNPYEFELNGLKVVVYAENKEKAKEIFVQKTIGHDYLVHTNASEEISEKLDKAFEDGYNIGREARDREIAEGNVFYSNKHIEDIVLEVTQNERTDCIKSILELKPKIYKWLIKRDTEGYGTTLGECVDKIFEEIEKTLKVTK